MPLGRIKPKPYYSERQLNLIDFIITNLSELNSSTARELRRFQFAGKSNLQFRARVTRYSFVSTQMETMVRELEQLRCYASELPQRIVISVGVICNDCPKESHCELQNGKGNEALELLLTTLDSLREAILDFEWRLFRQNGSRWLQQPKLYAALNRLRKAADRQRRYVTEGLPAQVPQIKVVVDECSEFCSMCGKPVGNDCERDDLARYPAGDVVH
jgi:hypothetical protein